MNPKIIYADSSFSLLDISHLLPRNKNWPYNWNKTGQYLEVTNRKIIRVYWHQTAGNVPAGLAGPMATASWIIHQPNEDKPNSGGRGWPGMPYHFFIPYVQSKPLVVYQCQPIDIWSWHTGGKDQAGRSRNKFGVGVVCQGRFKTRHKPRMAILKGQTGQPSDGQLLASDLLWSYLKSLLDLDDECLSGHFEAGKLTCPGDQLESWVLTTRAGGIWIRGNYWNG